MIVDTIRVRAAMLIDTCGGKDALRARAKAEKERGTDSLRVVSALSVPYLRASEEKLLLDAMLLAEPR